MILRRGDTAPFLLTITDPATKARVDLSGALLWFTVKERITDDDADALYQVTESDGITVLAQTGATLGQAYVTPPSALQPGAYLYDVQVEDVANVVFTPISGTLWVQADVTRTGDGS
jgi:hypothetical protein